MQHQYQDIPAVITKAKNTAKTKAVTHKAPKYLLINMKISYPRFAFSQKFENFSKINCFSECSFLLLHAISIRNRKNGREDLKRSH